MMNKRLVFIVKILWAIFVIAFVTMKLSENRNETLEREPYWEKIEAYQRSIKPEMIISIEPDERFEKLVTDWKLDELAFALANAKAGGPAHPMGFGSVTIKMDTTGTELEPDVRLALAYAGEDFVAYFRLTVMKDNKPYTGQFFVSEELNEWARSVGIANKTNW